MAEPLAGMRVVSFESRRAEELSTMLRRHGAEVLRAPALRETPLAPSPEALELARRLQSADVGLLVLMTGVGTRTLAAVLQPHCPQFVELLGRTMIVARGPKPLAVLRELGVAGAPTGADTFSSPSGAAVVGR